MTGQPLGAMYEFRFTKIEAPTGFKTAYEVFHDGFRIGYVASEVSRPIVPRHTRPTMRSGKSPVTTWYAAERKHELDGLHALRSDQRHDAAEQLLHRYRRAGG